MHPALVGLCIAALLVLTHYIFLIYQFFQEHIYMYCTIQAALIT